MTTSFGVGRRAQSWESEERNARHLREMPNLQVKPPVTLAGAFIRLVNGHKEHAVRALTRADVGPFHAEA